MDEILKEYKDVLGRKKFGIKKSRIGKFINDLKNAGVLIDKIETKEKALDPNDEIFYEVVVAGRQITESYLVTGNIKHFPKKPFVVTPAKLLEILSR